MEGRNLEGFGLGLVWSSRGERDPDQTGVWFESGRRKRRGCLLLGVPACSACVFVLKANLSCFVPVQSLERLWRAEPGGAGTRGSVSWNKLWRRQKVMWWCSVRWNRWIKYVEEKKQKVQMSCRLFLSPMTAKIKSWKTEKKICLDAEMPPNFCQV